MRDIIIGIYCIENKIDNKKYIGQAIDFDDRIRRHKRNLSTNKHCNRFLQFAWNKYGENNFKFYLVEECPREQLNSLEEELVEYYNTTDKKFGYNMTIGGAGIKPKWTKESKDKIKNRKIWWLGKNHSDESKKKISENRKGVVPVPKNVTKEEWSNSVSKGQRHIKRNKNNKHVGIYFYKNNNKKPWHARISVEKGIKINIGFYSTEQEAIDAWKSFYFNYYGEKYDENN